MSNLFLPLTAFVAVVLMVLFRNSDAAISSDLSRMLEVEKYIYSNGYQNEQEAILTNELDKDSLAARITIEAIKKDVFERHRVDEFFEQALKPVIDAVVNPIRVLANIERIVKEEFDAALKLTEQNKPNEAIESVKKLLKYIRHIICTTGVPIEDTFGAALSRSGGANIRAMKNSMNDIQSAGSTLLESMAFTEEIATKAIEAGGVAAADGLKAAYEAFATGCTTSYEFYRKSAHDALDAYASTYNNSVAINRENQVSGILKSLTSDFTTTSNPAALSAIASLKNGLKSLSLSTIASQNSKDASAIMTQALVSTILETADAMAMAKNALQEAGKLAIRDKETAIINLLREIELAREEVIRGTTIGFLGFGAARYMAGDSVKVESLFPAMLKIIFGRVTAYDDLKIALDIALLGIRGGNPLSISQGINAAVKICDVAGKALFQEFNDGGQIGLDIFRST